MSWKDYLKVVCLFCNATVEGNEEYMLGGKTLPDKRGKPPKWLMEKPEHRWAWNGLTSQDNEKHAIFYLCPDHQTSKNYKRAFEWAEKHTDRR